MTNKYICTQCFFGYNEDWVLTPQEDKIIICPKCGDKFKFDINGNFKELGFKNE